MSPNLGEVSIGESINWQADLLHLAQGIVRQHRQPFHLISQATFDARVAELSAGIASLSDNDALVALRGIAASIGDGHTFIAVPRRPRLPLELYWCGKDLTVIRAGMEHRDLLGQRVLAIGDRPVAEVQTRLQPLIAQGENEGYVLARSAELLCEPEIITALGLEPSFRFADHEGRESVARLEATGGDLTAADNAPLPMQRPSEPFWFEHLAPHNAVYVQFRSYNALQHNVPQLIDALRQQPADRLIIDLRQNGGGNFYAGRQSLLLAVHHLGLVRGQLFVLVGRRTFSASMVNAIDFARETEAILVGEPIGGRPWGYQENGWFTLPGSGLNVSVATRLYRFGPENEPSFNPDHRIDVTHGDVVAGRDRALDWALRATV